MIVAKKYMKIIKLGVFLSYLNKNKALLYFLEIIQTLNLSLLLQYSSIKHSSHSGLIALHLYRPKSTIA